jgi:sulfopyruvate decarboxylase alpha subunit
MKQVFNILDEKPNEYADHLHKVLKKYKINFATGVPCGEQKHIIYNLSHDPDILHIPATREAEAIGIAAGAYLSGKRPVVYMQNSGLFDSSNDIASLLIPYKIPVLLSVSWRGCPGEDAPQHLVTGKATKSLLDSIEIPYEILEKDNIDHIMSNLFELMEEKQIPVTMLIRRGWHK